MVFSHERVWKNVFQMRLWKRRLIEEEEMFKIMALLFVMVAPTLAGISVIALLATSSPVNGGTPLSQQGSMLLILVIGSTLAALPISYFVARMISRTMGKQAENQQ